MAAKLIFQRFSSPAHLGANKTHHSVWLLSFEFSSVITKVLPKVLSVLVLPQWIPMVPGKCRAAAEEGTVVFPVGLGYSFSIFFKCLPHNPAFWPWNSRLRLFSSAPIPSQLPFLGQAADNGACCVISQALLLGLPTTVCNFLLISHILSCCCLDC